MLNTSHARERYEAGWTRKHDIADECLLEHVADWEIGKERAKIARKVQRKLASSPLFGPDDFDSPVHADKRDGLPSEHTTGDSIDDCVHKLVSWLALPDCSGGLKKRLEAATASVQDAFADARLRLIDLLTHCEAVNVLTRERYADQWGQALSDPHWLASVKHEINQAAHESLRTWAFTGSHNGMPFVRQSIDDVNQSELDLAVQAMHHHLTDGTSVGHQERAAAARRIFRKGYVGVARMLKQSGAKANVIALKLSGRRKLCRTLAAIALGESMELALAASGYKSADNFYSLANRTGLFRDCGLEIKAGRGTPIDIASHLAKNGRKPASFSE